MKALKKTAQEIITKNHFLTLNKKTFISNDGNKHPEFYILEFTNWANVVAVTPQNEVVMIEQFRAGIEDVCLELPGGVIEKYETNPIIGAKRELIEETGYECEKMEQISKVSANPAIQNNYVFGFLGTGAKLVKEQNLDENEDIDICKIPIIDIPELITNGKIHHSYSILNLMTVLNKLGIEYKL